MLLLGEDNSWRNKDGAKGVVQQGNSKVLKIYSLVEQRIWLLANALGETLKKEPVMFIQISIITSLDILPLEKLT